MELVASNSIDVLPRDYNTTRASKLWLRITPELFAIAGIKGIQTVEEAIDPTIGNHIQYIRAGRSCLYSR
ncbi:hypothetical protein KSD_24360 [Ktedonobacter sp. SOSP1-85]|nr:hypothetical protein KSD_24360 [Ktedonobacter sp. SOSP1-85]